MEKGVIGGRHRCGVHTTIQPQIMALLAAVFAWRAFNVPVPLGFA